MIILLSLSISGGSELCFDNLVKLRAADLKKSSPDPQKPTGPNPAGKDQQGWDLVLCLGTYWLCLWLSSDCDWGSSPNT